MVLVLDGRTLTCAQLVAASAGPVTVQITAPARLRAEASARLATTEAARRPVYGRTTGVGANSSVTLATDGDAVAQALSLLLSHATGVGPPRAPHRVRAMLLVRLNQLAAGASGASVRLVDALAELLARPDLPPVREHVGIGTGDLAALARIGVELGVGAGGRLEAGDALALMSSNAAVIADAALAHDALDRLARAAVVVAALSSVVLRGNGEAWSSAAERATPFPGAGQVCRWMRRLTGPGLPPAWLQDPFALRALPQSVGPVLDALAGLRDVVEAMANVAAENPLAEPDDGVVVHHGGFHATYLALALDGARLAIAQAATGSVRRLGLLMDPKYTALPPFLGDGTPGASGAMLLEYHAAGAAARLRQLATPASLDTAMLSRGIEDDASMAPQAASAATLAADELRTVLACELVAAQRGWTMQGRRADRGTAPDVVLPAALGRVVSALIPSDGSAVDRLLADRDLSGDVDAAERALDRLADLPALTDL